MSEFLATLGIGSASALLSAVVTLVICIIAIKLLMKVVDRVLNKSTKIDGTLKGFVRSAANILLWILAVIIVANALGINTSSPVRAEHPVQPVLRPDPAGDQALRGR